MSDYLPGSNYGLPESVMVHRWANIAGDFQCGEHCRIDAFVTVTGKVRIGARTHLSTGSAIFGGAGVKIGDGCSLSPGAKIFTASDDISEDLLANPQLVKKHYKEAPVIIGDFCSIGANSVVLCGCEIEDEVQIGANSVVRFDTHIPRNQVWAGLPAHYLCPRVKLNRAKMMGYEILEKAGA